MQHDTTGFCTPTLANLLLSSEPPIVAIIRPTPLTVASRYLTRGWQPVPISHGEKGPTTPGWQKLNLTEGTLGQYFGSKPMNIGVLLGPRSNGLTDIDLDCGEAIALARHYLPRTTSWFGRASKPHSHFLYTINDAPDQGAVQYKDIEKRTIIELRIGGGAQGAQTVFPGSTHESGEPIEWVCDGEPAHSTFEELKKAVSTIAVGVVLMRSWPQGSGHNAALALGGFLARVGWSPDDIAKLIKLVVREAKWRDDSVRTAKDAAAAFARGEKTQGLPSLCEQFGEKEGKAVAKHLEYSDDEPVTVTTSQGRRVPAFSEEAIALQFADRHAGELRHVATWSKWMRYDGSRWQFDDKLITYSLSRELCREVAVTANKAREAKNIANAKTRAAVVSLAREDSRLAASIDQWDCDDWLLNTPDGVVDLRTGDLRPHRTDDYMTKLTAVTPHGDCPQWKAFLTTVTGKNDELKAYIQRVLGYALTGVTNEHALFFLYGLGQNGKGVMINTVAGILADYHRTANQETFAVTSNEQHPTELAMLRGARLVTVSETEAGKRWAESRIKQLTGGDTINARFMRQDFFEFQPKFKLMISGNHRPGLNSVNFAIRRRVNMLPFTVTISEEQRDKDLTAKLKAEWPGILQWMIEGCLEWQRIGLKPPKVVTDATDDYLETEDKLGRWIAECLERDPNGWASSSALFASWKSWAESNGEWVGSQTKLSINLKDAGFEPARKETGNGFAGLNAPDFNEYEKHHEEFKRGQR
jgi:putative DNA primase/helicase